MLLASTTATVLAGALFCGWLCPLGSVQDWMGRLGRRLFGRRYNTFVPPHLDRALGFLRYAVLGLIVLATTRAISLVFAAYDPYFALLRLWTGDALPTAIAVLALVLAASLFVERPWCRYLCPLGAATGLLGALSPVYLKRESEACKACAICTKACPMGLPVHTATTIKSPDCIGCLECVDECPREGALELKLGMPVIGK
jgi:polyferredoxin